MLIQCIIEKKKHLKTNIFVINTAEIPGIIYCIVFMEGGLQNNTNIVLAFASKMLRIKWT